METVFMVLGIIVLLPLALAVVVKFLLLSGILSLFAYTSYKEKQQIKKQELSDFLDSYLKTEEKKFKSK